MPCKSVYVGINGNAAFPYTVLYSHCNACVCVSIHSLGSNAAGDAGSVRTGGAVGGEAVSWHVVVAQAGPVAVVEVLEVGYVA